MFKQIKKLFIALVLVFALFLVACEECPECEECPTCPTCEEFKPEVECPENGYITEEECPKEECPEFNAGEECPENGYIKPEECPECEGYTAPTEVIFYSDDIVVGKDVKFEVEITPADAYQGLVWSTSNPEIATVDEEGNITGVRPGMVTITAKSALNAEVMYEEELEVIEKGLLDFEIAEREKNAIVAALSAGYVSGNFDLPTTWNQNATVTYMDPNGNEIETFVMPDLGDATSQNYAISGNVTYGDAVSEFNVTLKLVKAAEGKNDYEKVDFAVEVAQAFLYDYINGTKVTESVYLPASVYGIALGWSTNKAYVLDNAGVLYRPNNDTSVTYSITPKCGAASRSTSITVVAAGYTADEKIKYLKEEGVLKDIVNGKFTASIALPEKDDKFGIHLTYVSEDETVISSEGVVSNELSENTKVKFTVTAVYNDANAADTAFVEVFEFEVTALAGSEDTEKLYEFNRTHEQLAHIPYGAGTEQTYVIDPVEGAALKAAGYEFKGDENFKVNSDGSVELVTQYFRYHEAKLTVKHGTASYVWVINVGIGEVNDIIYIGGRTSYQSSANPNERVDMLQGFSKWDKYVGIVSNNSERNNQQYWSEFSGYTYYVDIPTGNKVTKFTKDAEGNVTVVAYETDEFVRQQVFQMQFSTFEITKYVPVYEPGKTDIIGYLPKVNTHHLRSTYGGNFANFYVNLTDKDLEIPVSSISITAGATFTDGNAIKSYSKSSISLALTSKGSASEVKDDYGNTLKISRNDTWAIDGYRPAVSIAPKTDYALVDGVVDLEGKVDQEYKFVVGVEDALNNPGAADTCIQSCVPSTLSKVWGTPYVVVAKKGGMLFGIGAQNHYGAATHGGLYYLGQDKSLKVYASKYFRHAENEEITDYFINQVNSTLKNFVEKDADYSKVTAEDIKYEDISIANLEALDTLYAEYATFKASWQAKSGVVEAKRRLDAMKTAAQTELDKQEAYALLTKESFDAVKAEIQALAALPYSSVKNTIEGASFQAKVAAANRNYAALTAGQKGLYDEGYVAGAAGLSFAAQQTAGILDAITVELQIINLKENLKVSANASAVKAASDAYAALKNITLNGGTKASDLITPSSVTKLTALEVAKEVVEVKADTAKITAAVAKYNALSDAQKAYASISFKDDSHETLTGIEAFEAKMLVKVAQNAEATKLANEEKTLKLAKEIKDAINLLPNASEFKKGNYTADQVKSMKALVDGDKAKIKELADLYYTLGIITVKPTDKENIIAVLVKGAEIVGDNPATTEVETKYLNTKIGNFAGEGEEELLKKAYSLPEAYDEAEANKVIEKIELLPGAKLIALEDEAAVKAARSAYKNLTATQKPIVDRYTSENYIPNKLVAAEKAIEDLKLEAKIYPVELAINSIGVVTALKLEDAAKVAEAQTLFGKLSATEQTAVSEAMRAQLTSAVAKIKLLKEEKVLESDTYKAAVKAFGENTEIKNIVDKDTKAGAEALVSVYEAMSADEQEYFAEKYDNYDMLYKQLVSALAVYNLYA